MEEVKADWKALAAEDKKEREAQFGAGIERLAKELRCTIRPVVVIAGNQIQSRLEIVAEE